MQKTKLFCLPYAGGSAMMFYKWKNQLADYIELIPLELPGRGRRAGELLVYNLEDLVDLIYLEVKDHLDQTNVAFFGYSMGSTLAFELAHRVEKDFYKEVSHLFLAASRPPHLKRNFPAIHSLPQNEFEERIYELGGTPKDLFNNEEVRRYFMPLLRADFKMVETYKYVEKVKKLSSDFTVIMGREDSHNDEWLSEWSIHTYNTTNIHYIDGGHFFIYEQTETVINLINKTLEPLNYLNTVL